MSTFPRYILFDARGPERLYELFDRVPTNYDIASGNERQPTQVHLQTRFQKKPRHRKVQKVHVCT